MVSARHFLSLAAVAVLTCGLGGAPSGDSAFAESSLGSANRITAVYRVDLAGFNLGDFRLTTQFRGTDYEMRGEGRFSVLSGLVFDWRGTTASKGRFNGTGPEPAMYSLNFQGGDKSQQLRMTFDGGAVTQISRVPKKRPNPHVIPITKEQLEGVLDPMTAAFLYARSGNPNGDPKVCDQTMPVFDGEARFNLILKPKRTVKLQKEFFDRLFGICRRVPREVHSHLRLPARQSRHQADDGDERDRSLARVAAGHRDVRALSHCAADARRLWLCDLNLLPDSARRQARKPRLERSSKPARQGVNGEGPNPNM